MKYNLIIFQLIVDCIEFLSYIQKRAKNLNFLNFKDFKAISNPNVYQVFQPITFCQVRVERHTKCVMFPEKQQDVPSQYCMFLQMKKVTAIVKHMQSS